MTVNFPPFPSIDGKPITREDIIEGLWSAYGDSVRLATQDDCATTGFPDLMAAITYIEEFGLPPKEKKLKGGK